MKNEAIINQLEKNVNEICNPHGFKASVLRDYKFQTLSNGEIDYIPIDQDEPGYGYRLILEGPLMSSELELNNNEYNKGLELSEKIKKKYKKISDISITIGKKS